MDDQDKFDESRARYIDDLLHDLIPDIANLEGSSTDLVKEFISKSITNLEKRLKTYLSSIPKDDEEGLRRCMEGAESQEEYLMQIFTLRQQQGYRTGGPNIFILQDFLTKTMPEFLDDVNLDGTKIMDQLIQDEVMTDDERNSIIQESTPRRRKESFIGLMRGKLTWKSLKDIYIPAIEVDHPKVATKMRKTYTEITENPPPSSLCTVCSVKDAVQVQNLAQHLLDGNVITSGIYEELRSRNKSNSEKWTRLCEHISDHSSIIDALEMPSPQFYNLLKQNDVSEMKCFCPNFFEDNESLISNTNAYFDAGNNLLGDLDSVIGADTRKDAYGIPYSPIDQDIT